MINTKDMNRFFVKHILILTFLFTSFSLTAQNPVNYNSPEYDYQLALELFQKEKYGSAQQYFKYVYENTPNKQEDMKANSYFYMGVCASYLYNNDALFLLKDFIRKYPVHSYVPEANYFIGRFHFYKRQYKNALEYYKILDERDVKKDDIPEYYFKKGYCYFYTKNFDEAKAYFAKARELEGVYKLRAIYYLAFMAYQDGQHQAALDDFLLLRNEPEYQELVPLYIAQIYFVQKKYDELVAIAPPLLDKVAPKNQQELSRVIALSYYNLGLYEKASQYFELYAKLAKNKIDRSDYFAMGYSFYKQNEYDKAVEFLSKTVSEKDAMAQNSYYIIADCYLQMSQYNLASQSFLEASKSDFDSDIKEDALYNYAKLQFETSGSPFNSAIKALENYINNYPNSARSEEANSYLTSIYLSTKNYQAAIRSLENIHTKNPDMLRAYQRCTYFRALELLNIGKNREAIDLLNKSLTYSMDKNIRFSSMYWKAEAEYRNQQYKDAFFNFQAYQKQDGAKSNEYYEISFYSLGYSAMQSQRYSEARNAFSSFSTTAVAKEDPVILSDAIARIGDCYYMEKNPRSAIQYYEKCEKMVQKNADYALYQQAIAYGYLKNYNKKIELLQKLKDYYPKSIYTDDAEYELANTYHSQNNYVMAISTYKDFINRYPKNSNIRQAYNKMAQAYLNTQEEEMAIKTYKYVVENYPGSQEAKDAIANLETIYAEQGNTSDFFDYVRNRNVNISVSRQDSVTFKAAENRYLRGDCENAVKGFDGYIKQFPQGQFIAMAYFYKAECEYGMNNFKDALTDYEMIINQYQTDYNETALKKSASILYNNKEYEQALNYYKRLSDITSNPTTTLLANTGIMYTSYHLENYSEALGAAQKVLASNSLENDIESEAKLVAGRSAGELKDYTTAKKYLNELAKSYTNDFAAEAAYLTCLIEFESGNYDACEKCIIEMLSANYSSGADYWFASVFILYGDLYKARGNYFQARHTYQSIIDNYAGEDLRNIAMQKIAELDQLENRAVENETPEELPDESEETQE